MRRLLVPKDPRDKRNVCLEIRAGTGDAKRHFRRCRPDAHVRALPNATAIKSPSSTKTGFAGGYKEVIANIRGNGAYPSSNLRAVSIACSVPVTESQGRIHTSAATVAVIPELDEVDITLTTTTIWRSKPNFGPVPADSTCRKRYRCPHHPQTDRHHGQNPERAQLDANKQVGKAIIQARIQEMEEAKQMLPLPPTARHKVGSGDRSEKIRTYNYPQSRVTDHRIGLSSYNLSAVMDGDLDQFVDALTVADEAAKMAALEQ